ncbi:MAG: phospholipase D family protein, partial [Caldimonas sp.]
GRAFTAIALAAVLGACSSLPARPPLPPTHAITDYAATPLSAIAEHSLPGDTRSGFRLLPYGPNALAARVELAALAVRSLDVQYYLLMADNTGLTLMRALRDAAARGVRVRLLVDDLYTSGEDDVLLALASLPNVEVRLFNPFPGGRGAWLTRFMASAWEFHRVDRRMHNKLFVADNAAAIAGGRNMADAYVMNAPGSNFIDMDVLAIGPVVRDLSSAFDRYWNSEMVFPVQSIAFTPLSVSELRARLDRRIDAARPPETADPDAEGNLTVLPDYPLQVPPEVATMLRVHSDLARHDLGPLLAANARVLVDPPEKRGQDGKLLEADIDHAPRAIGGTVTEGVIRWLLGAQQSVRMVSPYFVPSANALVYLERARKAGLEVVVVTNSLASTDEPLAYAEYARNTRAMLAMGIELYELSPSLSVKRRKLGLFGKRSGALHLKDAVRDDSQVFLGSMNLDPRSAWLNTEIGLIIESTEMARQLASLRDPDSEYRLRLSADGSRVEWVGLDAEGNEAVYDAPPETSRWLRFKLWLLAPLIPRDEL